MSENEKRPLLGNDTSINSVEQLPEPDYGFYHGSNKLLIWINGHYINFRKGFSLKLFLMLVGLIFVGTANRVAFKIMTNSTALRVSPTGVSIPKYSTFIAQMTNFIYIPVFWPVVWYFMCATKRITPEMRAFPIWKYIVMGLLDSLAGVLMVVGGSQTSGPLQQLLIQGAVPFTMLFSFLVGLSIVVRIIGPTFKVHYRWTHLVGAALIIGGIVTALVPQLIDPSKGGQTAPGYAIMFFLAVIPTAISNVYKEIAFKGTDLDIFLVNAWVATFQFIIGFPLLPISVLPEKNPLASLKALPGEFLDGFLCFFGQGPDGDLCVQRLVMVHILVYLAINVFYNIFILAILKYGSATLLQISSALLLPLANITFTIKGIMNEFPNYTPEAWVQSPPVPPDYVPRPPGTLPTPTENPPQLNVYYSSLSPYDIGGLVIILVGIIFYRALSEGGEEKKEGEGDYEKLPENEVVYQTEASEADVSHQTEPARV